MQSFDPEILKKLRKSAPGRLRQQDVAEAVGMARGTYSKKETGTLSVTLDDLEALAKFYGLPIAAFFEKSEELINEGSKLVRLPQKQENESEPPYKIIYETGSGMAGSRKPYTPHYFVTDEPGKKRASADQAYAMNIGELTARLSELSSLIVSLHRKIDEKDAVISALKDEIIRLEQEKRR